MFKANSGFRRRASTTAIAAIAGVALFAQTTAAQSGPTTIIAPVAPPLLPESLAVDATGNSYATMYRTPEVHRFSTDGSRSVLATFRVGSGGSLAGIAADTSGLVVLVRTANAPETDEHGLWRVGFDGSKRLIARFARQPSSSGATTWVAMNDVLAIPTGGWFVSDSSEGVIYRVAADGTVMRWVEDVLLRFHQEACAPDRHPAPVGANGMALDAGGNLLVANTTKATIIRVPMMPDGSAGKPDLWYGPDCANLLGADGIVPDGKGGLYVAVNFRNIVVQVLPGTIPRTLATVTDGLDFPSSVKVGTGSRAGSLVVSNFAFVNFSLGKTAKPSIAAIQVGDAPKALPRAGALPWELIAIPAFGLFAAGVALRWRRS